MSDEHTADPYAAPERRTAQAAPAETPAVNAATARFFACRWHKPAEAGAPAHCTHRDVLSMAGATGFSADSWCTRLRSLQGEADHASAAIRVKESGLRR